MNCRVFVLIFGFGSAAILVVATNPTSQIRHDRSLHSARPTRSSGSSTRKITAGKMGFLVPADFARGSVIRAKDVTIGGVDPIPNSGKFEGDIDLKGLPYEAYVDKVIDDSPFKTEKDIGSSSLRGKWLLWENANVPYELDISRFSRYDRGVIASAITDLQRNTCIRWIPRQEHHRDFVQIIADVGCYSAIGRTRGRQYLSLTPDCLNKGTVIHEMMHAIGFFHEQARSDRDDYVTIKWDNIDRLARRNFRKKTLRQIDNLGTKYDYGSIMHYGRKYFSKNGGDTVIPRNSGVRIGQRLGLSATDIEEINKLYKCPDAQLLTTTRRPQVPVAFSNTCADENEHCQLWASNDQCNQTPSYMLKHCKQSCNVCPLDEECFDTKVHCDVWKTQGYCTNDNARYMKKYCKRSCGFC